MAFPPAANANASAAPAAPSATPAPKEVTAKKLVAGPKGETSKPYSVTLTPMYTFYTNPDANPQLAGQSGALRLDWNINVRLAKRLNAYYNHHNIDSLSGRVYQPNGKPLYPGATNDPTEEIGVSYAVSPQLSLALGLQHRWHACCPGAGDPNNLKPGAERGVLFKATYQFGPKTLIGYPFSVMLEPTEDHHFFDAAAQAALPKGTSPAPSYLPLLYIASATYHIPVAHQKLFVPWIQYQYFDNYFDNSPYPVLVNVVNYGATFTTSKHTAFDISFRNYDQHFQGSPYYGKNVQHYTWLILSETFKL